MNTITKHYPNWVDRRGGDGDDIPPECDSFTCTEDLLTIPWVKDWEKMGGFFQFSLSLSRGTGISHYLMAELDKGESYWVVGMLTGIDGVILPEWKAPK